MTRKTQGRTPQRRRVIKKKFTIVNNRALIKKVMLPEVMTKTQQALVVNDKAGYIDCKIKMYVS